MQYGVQRRNIYLVPPSEDDLAYVMDAFVDREVWEMFGFDGPAKGEMARRYGEGNMILGVIKRVEGRRRIGFGVTYPPPFFLQQWEYGIVIRDPKDRDAFAAIHASDAMTHYLFDHVRLEHAMWRIRADNGPPNAIARRMGYKPFGRWLVGEHRFNFYRMTQQIWSTRRERLFRAEAQRPSGIGAAFLTLEEPPFEPEEISASSGPKEAAEPPASES